MTGEEDMSYISAENISKIYGEDENKVIALMCIVAGVVLVIL